MLCCWSSARPGCCWPAFARANIAQGWAQKLLGLAPDRESTATCVWLHAVSLGEVSLIAPLVAELRRRHPDWDIAISTTTLTGYTLARTRYREHMVFYCPLDFSWAVRAGHAAACGPTLLVLAELELWPNLIAAARDSRRQGGDRQRPAERSQLSRLPAVRRLARRRLLGKSISSPRRTQLYAERFLALGARPTAVHVTGSLKFDGAQTDRDNPATTAACASWPASKPATSCFWPAARKIPKSSLALEAFRQLAPQLIPSCGW